MMFPTIPPAKHYASLTSINEVDENYEFEKLQETPENSFPTKKEVCPRHRSSMQSFKVVLASNFDRVPFESYNTFDSWEPICKCCKSWRNSLRNYNNSDCSNKKHNYNDENSSPKVIIKSFKTQQVSFKKSSKRDYVNSNWTPTLPVTHEESMINMIDGTIKSLGNMQKQLHDLKTYFE